MSFMWGLGASLECARPAVDCISERVPACCKSHITETRWHLQQWHGGDVFDEEIVPRTPRMPEAPRLLTSQKLQTQYFFEPASRHDFSSKGQSKVKGELHSLEEEDDWLTAPPHPIREDTQEDAEFHEADDSSPTLGEVPVDNFQTVYMVPLPEELQHDVLPLPGATIKSFSAHGLAEPLFIPEPGVDESAIAMVPDVNEEPDWPRSPSLSHVGSQVPDVNNKPSQPNSPPRSPVNDTPKTQAPVRHLTFDTEQPLCTERYGVTWVEDVSSNAVQQPSRVVEPSEGLVGRVLKILGGNSSADQQKALRGSHASPSAVVPGSTSHASPSAVVPGSTSHVSPSSVVPGNTALKEVAQGTTFAEEGRQRLARRMDSVFKHVQEEVSAPVAASQSAARRSISIDPAAEAFAEAGRERLRARMDSVYRNMDELHADPPVPASPLLPSAPSSPAGSSAGTPTEQERRRLRQHVDSFSRHHHENTHASHAPRPSTPDGASMLVSRMDSHLVQQMKSVVQQLDDLNPEVGDSDSRPPPSSSSVHVERTGPSPPSPADRERAEAERAQERLRQRLQGTYDAKRPASPEGNRSISPESGSKVNVSLKAPTPASPVSVEQTRPRSPSPAEVAARERAEAERAQERLRQRLQGTYERPASPEGNRSLSPESSGSKVNVSLQAPIPASPASSLGSKVNVSLRAPTPASPARVQQTRSSGSKVNVSLKAPQTRPSSLSPAQIAAKERAEAERAQERLQQRLPGTYGAKRPASPEGNRSVSPASSSPSNLKGNPGSNVRFQLPGKRSRTPSPSGMRLSMHAVLSDLEKAEKQTYASVFQSFIQGSQLDRESLREFLLENSEIELGQLSNTGLIRQLSFAKLPIQVQGAGAQLEENPFFQGFLEILQELPLSTEMCMGVFTDLSTKGKSVEVEVCKERAGKELMSKYKTNWPWFRWEALLDAAFDGRGEELNKEDWLQCFKRAARMARLLRHLKI